MHCDFFEAGVCRSCTEIRRDYGAQLAAKDQEARAALATFGVAGTPGGGAAGVRWLPPVPSPVAGFRNRAKMVVGGTLEAPLLGILGPDLRGVDLTACLLCAPEIRSSFPAIVALIQRAKLPPYDVAARRGELKYVLVTVGEAGDLMVRFVLRTDEAVVRIRKHLSWFRSELPAARVVSVNLQPEPSAIVEGRVEILLTEESVLPMRLPEACNAFRITDGTALDPPGASGADPPFDRPLRGPILLPPGAFFQTNTQVAGELFGLAAAWVAELRPAAVLDLYCGVGGFALHAAWALRTSVRGVELHPAAVAAGRQTAALWGLRDVEFVEGDATASLAGFPELVIVNPPRRGIGERLAALLEGSGTRALLYSSCNLTSLHADLARLPSFRLDRAVVLDMFPHTRHCEILTLLLR